MALGCSSLKKPQRSVSIIVKTIVLNGLVIVLNQDNIQSNANGWPRSPIKNIPAHNYIFLFFKQGAELDERLTRTVLLDMSTQKFRPWYKRELAESHEVSVFEWAIASGSVIKDEFSSICSPNGYCALGTSRDSIVVLRVYLRIMGSGSTYWSTRCFGLTYPGINCSGLTYPSTRSSGLIKKTVQDSAPSCDSEGTTPTLSTIFS